MRNAIESKVQKDNELERLRIAAGIELEDSYESGSKWCVGDDELEKLVQLAKDEARAEATKVSRLDWVVAEEGPDDLCEAKTLFGLYALCATPKGVQVFFKRTPGTIRRLGDGTGVTMEQGKAAMLETGIQWTCDGCGNTEVWPEINVTKSEVRKKMKQDGWQSYGQLDYCPACVKAGAARRRDTGMGLDKQ